MSWPDLITLICLGFGAGILGGLLGIGGSIVMIPVLTLVLKRDQHLSQASAMIVNVFISAPALFRHHGEKVVEWKVVRRLLPGGLIFIVLGVMASNKLDGAKLMKIFGIFLLYVIFANVRRLIAHKRPREDNGGEFGWVRCTIVGSITGFMAGLLGIGGGIIAVPLLQHLCHMRLVRCIAVSAAAMCVTATVGAIHKNLVLGHLNLFDIYGKHIDGWDSVLIAACLAPTAIIGGHIGAGLTHSLPLRWVRIALVILLCVAAAKFLHLF